MALVYADIVPARLFGLSGVILESNLGGVDSLLDWISGVFSMLFSREELESSLDDDVREVAL